MVVPTSNQVVVPRLIPGLIIKTNDSKKDGGVNDRSLIGQEEETLAQRNERKAEISKLKKELLISLDSKERKRMKKDQDDGGVILGSMRD